MATARNNVTDINQFSRERQHGGGRRTPLDDCREISTLGLKKALDESLEQVKLQMVLMADKAVGLEMYHLYMDTLELARDHRAEIEDAFRKHFLQRFNLECRRDSTRIRKDVGDSELSLLAPDDLEESLASGTLANAIHNACVEELFGLDKRLGMLINDPDMTQGDNPLGPEVISDALMEALDERDTQMKARLLLAAQLSKHLPERVKEVYRDVNQQLIKKNVLPTIRVGLRRSSATAPAQAGYASQPGAEAGGDVFGLLQQLMGYGGAAPVAGPAGFGGSMSVPFIPGPAMPGEQVAEGSGGTVSSGQVGNLIRSLSLLQRGQVGELAQAGLDGAVLNAIRQGGGQVNVLHGLRNTEIAGSMTAVDAMTLDIVAMVFDYVLDDQRIPDAIKALIGRLQIPVLKVAMLDKSFFSQKSHPARRLLDALADAAIGWDATEGHEGGLYQKIEQLVEYVLQRYEDKVDVFSETLDQLNEYLAEERREAAEAMAPSVQAIKTREEAEIGLQIAHDEVQTAVVGHSVPPVIGAFLTGHWQRLLADIQQKKGEDSADWKDALDTMGDLIWSVAPKIDAVERKRLVDMLPGLLKRLDQGASDLGMTQSERDEFFATLVRCHADAVKAGLSDETQEMQPETDLLAGFGEVPLLDRPAGFVPVVPVPESVVDTPTLLEELAAGNEEMPVEEIAIGDLRWGGGELEPTDAETELGTLKRGSWIEYMEEDGTEVRAKLSWISPMKGMYLFTNRHGQRAISINSDALLAKLHNGEVRVLNDAPLMDRAVGNLMERLQRHAA